MGPRYVLCRGGGKLASLTMLTHRGRPGHNPLISLPKLVDLAGSIPELRRPRASLTFPGVVGGAQTIRALG